VTPNDAFDVEAVQRRLADGNGGYESVHESDGLEIGVYVLGERPRDLERKR
jgi:hypothetical protein